MTLVEFYDDNAINNILSSLILHPKRVIILGYDYNELILFKERMLNVFKIQEIETKIICMEIEKASFSGMKKFLSELVEKYGECVFDLSGGDSLIHSAVGAVSEKHPVSIHKLDPEKSKLEIICDENSLYKKSYLAKLSINEIVMLNGGFPKFKNYKMQLEKFDFIKDIKILWNICNKNCAEWNKTILNIGSVVKYYVGKSQDGVFTAKMADIYNGYKAINKKFYLNDNIVQKLVFGGFMSVLKNDSKTLSISFKNDYVAEILCNPGRLLELYTLMIGATIEQSGVRFFDDCESSVVIDWKNNPFDENNLSNHDIDVLNEIDVMFTKDVTPVFVSCKNGFFDADELYKLSVVADRFGGKYAKKILVTTYFEPDISFIRRANELGITLISNVDKLSYRKYSDKLCDAVTKKV